MKTDFKVPFNSHGDQLAYPKYASLEVQNFEFEDTLTWAGFERGQSAARLLFRRSNGNLVRMFLGEFDKVAPLLRDGKLTGTFTFCKRGTNFGTRMIGEQA